MQLTLCLNESLVNYMNLLRNYLYIIIIQDRTATLYACCTWTSVFITKQIKRANIYMYKSKKDDDRWGGIRTKQIKQRFDQLRLYICSFV